MAIPLQSPSEDFTFVRRVIVALACTESGIFKALEDKSRHEDDLGSLGLDPRALHIVLRAACESKLIDKADDGSLTLTDVGRAYLERAQPVSPFGHWLGLLHTWSKLPEVLRTGKMVPKEKSPQRTSRFMAAMAARSSGSVNLVADAIASRLGPGQMADLGGGPGVYSRAMIERGWKATLFDRPEMLNHVRETYGLDKVPGLELVAGDFLQTLPEGDFSLVMLGNILHIFSPATNRALLKRITQKYVNLQGIAILDAVVGHSPGAELFAVNMLVNTVEGDSYSLEEIGAWLAEVGFSPAELIDTEPEPHRLVFARRA